MSSNLVYFALYLTEFSAVCHSSWEPSKPSIRDSSWCPWVTTMSEDDYNRAKQKKSQGGGGRRRGYMLCCMWIWGLNFKMRWWFLTQFWGLGQVKLSFAVIKISNYREAIFIWYNNNSSFDSILQICIELKIFKRFLLDLNLTHNEKRCFFMLPNYCSWRTKKYFFTFISSRWTCIM